MCPSPSWSHTFTSHVRFPLLPVQVSFTGIEAKTHEGCPTAEWIIRRESKEELFLAVYRHHKGHVCDESYTVISIVLWDGLSEARAMQLYKQMTDILPNYGMPTPRRCEKNETCVRVLGSMGSMQACSLSRPLDMPLFMLTFLSVCYCRKSCACQGKDEHTSGCSFSFGCSWSVYYNGCKFAKSKIPRKFKLTDQSQVRVPSLDSHLCIIIWLELF